MRTKIPFILFSIILILSAGNSQAEDYLVWGKTTGYNTGTTGSGTSYNCSSNAGGFGTVSRDLWQVNSSTGVATNVASFDTNSCSGLTESGTSFETGSYVDKNSGNFYALQSDKTFKIFSGTDGSLLGTTTAPSLTNVTLDGLSHTGTATIVDTSGKKVLEKKSDGSIHIGENSLVTVEENGGQSLYATDASGNKISVDVNNGSDLLVNGTSVMGKIDGIATKASDGSVTIQSGTSKVKIAGGILADSSGNNIISKASNGTITLGSVVQVSDAAMADSAGVNIIRKDSDGAIHIGENSFVTREFGGHQEIYGTNAAGNPIDLNVTNGSDLLVNGTSVMGSIRGLADGVKATTALNAAFSSVPTMSGDRAFECGMGLGNYAGKSAVATSCGARLSDQLTTNFGASYMLSGSESYLLGELPAVAFRAGISFKFGASYGSSNRKMAAVNDASWNSFQLSEAQREVDGLRDKVASLESFKAAEVADKAAEVAEMKSLKAEVAEMKLMMAGLLGNRVVAMR